ncbi:NAD-dependent glycerol-3-phosphate dehydrogenase N-terminus [Dethiosulfatibacter aminovorans DSM 17477]|uniref:NAD-dependent glycerol-3-phosphate dehydrogenase N-terminus n=1 Tax=Dethiosulfatibacter aminovorans DSM 17477 TaxID=1121476 RepID=A0A1M6LXY7_9FIRM|nr:NAD(P)-binding domain-containing protein [Dethiosulfatibacter aminovorans]SHJ76042.1 NAD-dependent glycerol-3-phosphate dehydrogenase N-terminus [Dethiosulfatibacter aminovorans DSM 17477]
MNNKKTITVLGGGHGAHAMAADLTLRGYEVTMFEMPEYKGNLEQLFKTKEIKITGVINGVARIANVTSDIDEAVKDAKVIALVVPAFAHTSYAELLNGKLSKNQTLILYPGTFGSMQFKNVFENDNCPIIAETDTLPYDARLKGPCHINVFGTNVLNIAFLPSLRCGEVIGELSQMYEFKKIYEDVLECGLSSINPALHSGPCLLNLGPIEYWARGDFYLY